MANIDDREKNKFKIDNSSVIIDTNTQVGSAYNIPQDRNINDLEADKFDSSGKVRILFTT